MSGRRVSIPASDHPHTGESGIVVSQAPCPEGTGYDDLTVSLDSGAVTTVYEPDVDPLD